MATPTSRIAIDGDSNRVQRQKPKALKPYMNDEVWDSFCNDLDTAMEPWVALTRKSSQIARALGVMFLVFVVGYTAVKLQNITRTEIDLAAYVLFPMLMLVVAASTCWLIHVLPQTNGIVAERIEKVLEGATEEINKNMQRTSITMEYEEDEVHQQNGKSLKWIKIRIVNEDGEVMVISGDGDEENPDEENPVNENEGSFTLV